MGVVYEAYDREREAAVALKTVRRSGRASASQLKNEFRALADVVHPNLVGLYELIAEGDDIFFTMELIEGVPLLDWVWSRDPPPDGEPVATPGLPEPESHEPWTQSTHSMNVGVATSGRLWRPMERPRVDLLRLRDVARQLALGIDAIHQAGKLHRDLKPSNVLVTGDGRVVILDFGLAEELGELGDERRGRARDEGLLVGTAPYMSPEQCAREKGSAASDWYSLGAILYQALTGRAPFLGSSLEIMADKQRFEPPAPREIAEDVPEDLDALVVDLLRRDPRARPRVAQIFRRLGVAGAQYAETLDPPTLSSGLVGREHEMAELGLALERTRRGERQLVRVYGASGCGKSALVDRFLDQVGESDCLILRGRCYERESVPYKALDPIMEQLARLLARSDVDALRTLATGDTALAARIFPSLHRLEREPDGAGERRSGVSFELRQRAFAAVRRLFERLARTSTVVIFIDDLQWGDADSVPLLDELVADPRAPALLVIVAYRSEGVELNPLVAHLAEQSGQDIEIGSLPAAQGELLARQLLQVAGLPPERAAAIAREAHGHPFFTHELVRLASTDDAEVAVGLTVDRVIEQRVLRLPAEARRLLTTTAIAGSPTEIGVVAAAAEVQGAELMKAVNLLRARQLVRTSGARHSDTVEPYHDRVGETVVGMVDPDQARARHLALAHALLDAGRADAEALARHFLGAGDARRGVEFSLEAAGAAERTLAFARAAKLYEQALGHGRFDDAYRRELNQRLGDALAHAGLGAQAADAYLIAADGADSGHALELRRRAALQNLCSGHVDQGMGLLGGILGEVGLRMASSPRRALLRMGLLRLRLRLRGLSFRRREPSEVSKKELTRADVCCTVTHAFGLYDVIRSLEFQTRALLLALGTGDPERVALALAIEIFAEATGGRRTARRTRRLLGELERLIEETSDPLLEGWMYAARTGVAFGHGEFEQALQGSARTLEVIGPLPGRDYERSTIALFGLWSLYFLGRWSELDERQRELDKEARQRGDLYSLANFRTGILNAVWLMRDRPDRARSDLADAMKPWPERRFHLQHHWQILAECQTALYLGEAERAWDAIARGWGPFHRSMFNRMEVVRIEAEHLRARAAIALARSASGARVRRILARAERAAAHLARERAAWAGALAVLVRGSVADARGDRAGAAQLLEDGAARCDGCGLAGYAAAARVRRAAWLGEDGRAARDWFTAEGVVAPDRMARMMVP